MIWLILIETICRVRRELSRTSPKRPSSERRPSIFSQRNTNHADDIEAAADGEKPVDLSSYLQNRTHDQELLKGTGVYPKKIGISFRNLTVSGYAGDGWIMLPTFPEKALELFGWGFVKLAMMMLAKMPEPKPIIQGFSGVVRPGEMLLVLGKPGSGSSTFLRALTNQPRGYTRIDGDIDYAGMPFELALGKYRGEILYNDEGGF